MEEIGHRSRALVAAPTLAFAATTIALTALVSAAVWPFAIDDAWISVRYARHLAAGLGYVWNVGSKPSDGVTPLPWALMLAPFASAAPAVVLGRAKLAGAIVWSLTAGAWAVGVADTRSPRWAKATSLVVLVVDLPVAAHAVSGMETAFATSLATFAALSSRRPWLAATFAGLAAALRPELVVWSLVLSAGFVWLPSTSTTSASDPNGPASPSPRVRPSRVAASFGPGAIAAAPFILCAVVRLVVFGRAAPLSALAKPSDLTHGLSYAGAAAIFSLAPVLLVTPRAWRQERGPAVALTLAAAAHFAVVVAVGGDWMPYARLIAPIVPSMLLAFVRLAAFGAQRFHAARVVAALAVAAWLMPASVAALRRAGAERAELIAAAEPLLRGVKSVATVDIGWVSALHEGAIVDLAGVTDPEIAALGGGHTSKRIDAALLLSLSPDIALFYANPLPPGGAEPSEQNFPRVVEARLVASPVFSGHFRATAPLPLGKAGAGYILFRRR